MTDPARYDLHVHTCWSYDATAEPVEYFRRADQLSMRCLAVTEHHVLDSQEEVREAARQYPDIRVIPAAELSVTTSIGPVDLLCYGFPPDLPPGVRGVMETYHQWQRQYGAACVRGMRKLGFDFTEEDHAALLDSYRPARALSLQGRTRIRNGVLERFFLQRGFIRDPSEYPGLMARVGKQAPLPPYPPVGQVVPEVRSAGALVAIAHPAKYFLGADTRRMDGLCQECRLDGIECAHPAVPDDLTRVYRDYCLRRGLFSSAGTDCHDPQDITGALGRHGGGESWLDELLDRLDRRA